MGNPERFGWVEYFNRKIATLNLALRDAAVSNVRRTWTSAGGRFMIHEAILAAAG